MTSLYPTSNPLTNVLPSSTANSTPQGSPSFNSQSVSNSVPTNSQTSANTNAVMTPNISPTPVVATPATTPDVATMYSPTLGPSTQKVADATYTSKILDSVGNTNKVPSTDITSGATYTGANAKRSASEAMLQQYLDNQKAFQDKYITAITPSAEEKALQKRVAELKTQAGLNQEQALNSGETSSFAGGEAQRVGRTDAIKLAGEAEALQALQGERDNTLKQLQYLQSTNDGSLKIQLEIQKLTNEVSGIDKQAQDTFFNIAQNEGLDIPYDPNKTATENLSSIQQAREKVAIGKAKDLTPRQATMLNSIINQANNSPLIKAADRAVVLKDSIDNARKNPKAGYVQQNLVYSYVQALDTYQSAVREGEMKAVSNLDSLFGQFDNQIQKINNGQYARPEVVKNMADAAEMLYKSISKAAEQKDKSFEAQADVLGVGEDYMTYRGKFQRSYEESASTNQEQQPLSIKGPKGETYTNPDDLAKAWGYTPDLIDNHKKKKGFSSVGSDTNPATSQDMTVDGSQIQSLMNREDLLSPVTYKAVIPATSKLSYANNNPGNLKFAGQDGAVKGNGGFAKFNSVNDGVIALSKQIQIDINRGHTLASFISKFAPPTENDTKLYISQAMNKLGVSADTPLSKVNKEELLKFMALKESSTKIQ